MVTVCGNAGTLGLNALLCGAALCIRDEEEERGKERRETHIEKKRLGIRRRR
jgi:hypothetical protein